MKAAWLAAACVASASFAARAYPTLIRHGYTQCASCHTDPSGGTLLNAYGRAQSQLLLSTAWGKEEAEPSQASKQLFGLVELPEALSVGGWVREGYLWAFADGQLVDHRLLQMRADVAAALQLGPFRAEAELGYAKAATVQLASITRNEQGANLVSRQHWVGLALAQDAALLRAGRINLPYGLRNLEHTSFVRTATSTDTNEDQQDGVALSYSGESLRAEVMAIAGNYSLRPDALRERGGAGTAELAVSSKAALGVSALVTRADAARDTLKPTLRQAYGLTARVAPVTALVLSAEFDTLVSTALGARSTLAGHASWLQADLEPVRGFHLVGAGETQRLPGASGVSTGLWGGAAWFIYSHLDVRADWIRRWTAGAGASDGFLIQFNGYL